MKLVVNAPQQQQFATYNAARRRLLGNHVSRLHNDCCETVDLLHELVALHTLRSEMISRSRVRSEMLTRR